MCRISLIVVVRLSCLSWVRLPIMETLVAILPRMVAWSVFGRLIVLRQVRCLVI